MSNAADFRDALSQAGRSAAAFTVDIEGGTTRTAAT